MQDVSNQYPLVDLKIPEGVTEIRPYAYQDGEDLRSVSIPASVTKIGEGAFDGCINLEEIMVHPDNRFYKDCECGMLFSKDETRLIRVPENCHGVITLVPPLEMIEKGALKGCSSLNAVLCTEALYPQIPKDLEEDQWGASVNLIDDDGMIFTTDKIAMGPALWPIQGSYRVPDGVQEIDALYALWSDEGFDDFTEIIIPATVTDISPEAFQRCPNLTICAPEGSYPLEYAKENGIPYKSSR